MKKIARLFQASGCRRNLTSAQTINVISKRGVVSYLHQCSNTPLSYENIGHRFRANVEKVPEKELFVFDHQNIRKTYAEVYQDARTLAGALLDLGLRPGDRVGMWGPNNYEWLVGWFAAAIAGFIQVNINAFYRTNELVHTLRKAEVRALIAPSKCGDRLDYYQLLQELLPHSSSTQLGIGHVESETVPDLRHLIIYGENEPLRGAWRYEDLLAGAGTKAEGLLRDVEDHVQSDDPAYIFYTSGTTGLPKAATVTHRAVVNGCEVLGRRSHYVTGNHRLCLPIPLHHVLCSVAGATMMALNGQTAVFPSESFDVQKTLEVIAKEKCTAIYGSPTIYVDMMRQLPSMKGLDISSLHKGYIAGSPVPKSLALRVVNELDMPDLHILYGATETSTAIAISNPLESIDTRFHHVGEVMDHLEILLVDGKGKAVPRGTQGELLVRGYLVMRGYYGENNNEHHPFGPNRWYRTGDIAIMNENGTINIIDRVKDMIIRGGVNIYPSEIEQFLAKIDGIADAYVVGVPDERLGEELCAWIRLKDGADHVTPDYIRAECRKKIAHFKVPRYVLIKEDADIPRTPVGKVLKRELREISKRELNLGSQ